MVGERGVAVLESQGHARSDVRAGERDHQLAEGLGTLLGAGDRDPLVEAARLLVGLDVRDAQPGRLEERALSRRRKEGDVARVAQALDRAFAADGPTIIEAVVDATHFMDTVFD